MTPRPYSDRAPLPTDTSVNEAITGIPAQVLPESPSLSTLSSATTPSPPPQDIIVTEQYVDIVDIQDEPRSLDSSSTTPCYPTPDDVMPYDHSLPDFIRQITNQSNLANLQTLSLRVISTLISLHRMASYLPNLRELDLEGSVLNSLRDIGCSLKNLQVLKVGRCQLESLDGTFGLSSLRELYAQKNYITDVSPCSNLPHIRHIDVSGNRIRNISYAGFLSMCSKLKSIVFTGNPATEVADYRKHVRRILPQIESLDGISFQNEDNSEYQKDTDALDILSDSSAEVPDFSSVSPSDSMNNLLDFEEEAACSSDKKNKQAKNLANQDNFEGSDQEMVTVNDFQDEFKNITLQTTKGKMGLLEQAKANENKNLNIKQKSKSIRKLDKDLENRSKKSNLMLSSTSEDFSSSSQEEYLLDINLPSTSSSNETKEDNFKITRPSTTTGRFSHDSEGKLGVVRKRPMTANLHPLVLGEEDKYPAIGKLTTGLPVCGNLTAALRNRKKLQDSWNEKEQSKFKNYQTYDCSEESISKELFSQLNGSGDAALKYPVENEEDLVEEDVLTSSQKWREEFRRYRSNNRARWEEEDKTDYSNFLRDSLEDDVKSRLSENELPDEE